jgi:hypothetical protein
MVPGILAIEIISNPNSKKISNIRNWLKVRIDKMYDERFVCNDPKCTMLFAFETQQRMSGKSRTALNVACA